MFYKLNKAAMYAFAGVSLAAISGTAAADVLVTSSTGNAAREYPRGTRLGDSEQFVLRRGDTVVVLTRSGTRTFRGPGRFSATGSRRIASSAISRASTSGSRVRTGVIRGENGAGDTAEQYPERTAWQIDISDSGAVCYVANQPLTVWRPTAADPAQITITRRSDNASETIIFDEGQASHAWPAGFTAAPGAEYWINWDGNIVATRITFSELAVDATDQVAVGAAMHENNCDGQLDALTRQAAAEDDGSGDTG